MALVTALTIACLLVYLQPTDSCNEAVCASIVSKCMLTQSCKCDLKNCTCCRECSNCLSYLYSECCSCVEMCPKPNKTDNALSKQSQVEDLPDGVEGLFNALTQEPDEEKRWIVYTYPIDFNLSFLGAKWKDQHFQTVDSNVVTLNCTVAYMTQCMSWNKCKANCLSMGSSSYRWFHDGCCECIGKTCLNYGINDSRCPSCRENDENDDVDVLSDYADYGESNDQQEL